MRESPSPRVLRRSPGRLRVHAPSLPHEGTEAVSRIARARGVLDVRLNHRTANVLIEFDDGLIDESRLLALIAGEPRAVRTRRARGGQVAVEPRPVRSPRTRRSPVTVEPTPEPGWLQAARTETVYARPADCVAALLQFERYPEWQAYVDAVTVLERDKRGRGTRVATRGRIGEREIGFVAGYRFPSVNRVVFEQLDGELDAVRGSWAFRSLGAGRTRVTYALEVKPGWRARVMLRGALYEQLREAVLDHILSELRERVEGPAR